MLFDLNSSTVTRSFHTVGNDWKRDNTARELVDDKNHLFSYVHLTECQQETVRTFGTIVWCIHLTLYFGSLLAQSNIPKTAGLKIGFAEK